MTKEENLHWLNQEIRTWENECQSKHPIKEALHAARKMLEREPCEDAVSRAEVLNLVRLNAFHAKSQIKAIENMLPVTPQEPRKGHWIDNHNGTISCSSCHTWFHKDDRYSYMHYCPNCKVKIAESEEP
jgi:DNA-binding FadR family transcriptional regulator